jgi:hypothetical protein
MAQTLWIHEKLGKTLDSEANCKQVDFVLVWSISFSSRILVRVKPGFVNIFVLDIGLKYTTIVQNIK